MAIEYNFKYMPLVGKLSGESMVRQTETAINEIAQIVNDNIAQAEIINTLAETANSNSVEALEKAEEALETSGRVYIKETLAVNLNNYCESQLIYINNAFSQNMPVAHKGFLEVKTNDDKTQATQVFVDDVDRKFYVRTGAITATTVGDVTTYTASYGTWVNIPNITDLDNYLALAGGTMSGDIQFSASEWKIKGSDIDNDAELSIVGATDNLNGSSLNLYGRNHTESGAFELNANNGTNTKTLKGDASGNLKWDGNIVALAKDYLPLSGGTMTGSITFNKTNPDIVGARTTGRMGLLAGSNNFDGAGLQLFGRNDATYAGMFYLRASDKRSSSDSGGTVVDLVGRPNGLLTWNGNNVITAAGGTMTGAITTSAVDFIKRTTNDNHLTIMGGTAFSDSASIYLTGGDTSSNGGSFQLTAQNGTTSKVLVGKPDGTLTWGGTSISLSGHTHSYLPLSGGIMTGSIVDNTNDATIRRINNTGGIALFGGSAADSKHGAKLYLNGASHPTDSGRFILQAGNTNGYKQLIGTPTAGLTWGGSNVAVLGTLQNGHGILYGNKGSISVTANGYTTGEISFGQTFASTPMVVVCVGSGHAHLTAGVGTRSTTKFTYVVSSEGPAQSAAGINWIAVG